VSGGAVLPRVAGAGGIAWGVVLLARGDEVWQVLEGRAPGDVERLATQVLGVRHQVQGLAQLVAPRASGGVVVAVDVLHASSMAALAVVSPRHRRAALFTGGVALASAALTHASRGRQAAARR
jgi:hypothetical protein